MASVAKTPLPFPAHLLRQIVRPYSCIQAVSGFSRRPALALALGLVVSLTSSIGAAQEPNSRLAARRSLRFELSAFPQYWGVSTEYPKATLENLQQYVETDALRGGPMTSGWGLGVGARYHRVNHFGLQARLILGLHGVYAGLSNKLIAMTSGIFEFVPIIGPFGRFYAGPTLFGGALLFDGRAFLYPTGESKDRLVPLLVYGAGGEVGLHLGSRDEVAVLLKLLVGEVVAPPRPLAADSAALHLAAGAAIAF